MSRLVIKEFFFIILFSKFGLTLNDSNPLFFYYCGLNTTDNITLNSSLNPLFSKLISIANNSTDGSATTTMNIGTQNQLTGLMMCYIDSSQDSCSQCLNFSVANAMKICPGSSIAAFGYLWCFFQYYNTDNFIPQVMAVSSDYFYRNDVRSNSTTLIETVSELMQTLRLEAISSNSLFANDSKIDPVMNLSIYGLVQCTRNLNQQGCGQCLQYAIGNLTDYMSTRYLSVGTRMTMMSCFVRYELYPLTLLTFKSRAPAPAPIPESPSPILSPPLDAGSSGN